VTGGVIVIEAVSLAVCELVEVDVIV